MTALVSFDRVFEVLDLPPMIQEQPDARPLPRGSGHDRVRPRRLHATRPPTRSRSPRSSRWPCWRHAARNQVLFDVTFVGRAGPAGRPGRPLGRRQDHHQPPRSPASTTPVHGAVRINGIDVRDATLESLHSTGRRGHPGRPPLPRQHPREPPLRQARCHRAGASRRAGGGPDPHPGRVASPTGWTPSSATAATGSRAARSSAWPSPGCC